MAKKMKMTKKFTPSLDIPIEQLATYGANLGKQLADDIDAKVLASIQAAVDKVAEDIAFGHKINQLHFNPATGEVEVQMEITPANPASMIKVEFALNKDDQVEEIVDRFKALLEEVD